MDKNIILHTSELFCPLLLAKVSSSTTLMPHNVDPSHFAARINVTAAKIRNFDDILVQEQQFLI